LKREKMIEERVHERRWESKGGDNKKSRVEGAEEDDEGA